jgi:DNA-binding transcriptional LysR family regulator
MGWSVIVKAPGLDGNAAALDPLSRQRDNRRMLSPNDMLVFSAVAREGGVRHGATALGMPRSTVSRQLSQLEQTLGGRLIARSTRRFALTELGKTLQQQCEQLEDVLRSTSDVLARTATEPQGTLRVAASPVVGEELLPKIFAEYLRRCPKVTLDISLSVEFVDVRRGGFDVAVRTGALQEATDLFAAKLGHSLKGLYASRGYLKTRGTPQRPADLTQHACIVVGGRNRASWQLRGDVEVTVRGPLRTDSYRVARSAAAAGTGIALLPEVFARELVKRDELVPLLEDAWPRTTLYAVHAAGKPAPAKIRAFIEVLRAQLKL